MLNTNFRHGILAGILSNFIRIFFVPETLSRCDPKRRKLGISTQRIFARVIKVVSIPEKFQSIPNLHCFLIQQRLILEKFRNSGGLIIVPPKREFGTTKLVENIVSENDEKFDVQSCSVLPLSHCLGRAERAEFGNNDAGIVN